MLTFVIKTNLTSLIMAQKIVAGIDIGGTGTAYGIIDERGNILAQNKINTRDFSDFGSFVDTLYSRIIEMTSVVGSGYTLSGIGIGAPAVSAQTGRIEGAVDLPWPSPIDLRGEFSSKFGLPVGVNNDANVAAIGEATYGAARGLSDFIIITLGTGVAFQSAPSNMRPIPMTDAINAIEKTIRTSRS